VRASTTEMYYGVALIRENAIVPRLHRFLLIPIPYRSCIVAAVLLGAVIAAPVPSPAGATGRGAAAPLLETITIDGTTFAASLPSVVNAGLVKVVLSQDGNTFTAVDISLLKPGVTQAQFTRALHQPASSIEGDLYRFTDTFIGGTGGAMRGVLLRLKPGHYVAYDVESVGTGLPRVGTVFFTVTGSASSAGRTLQPPSIATVQALDGRFVLPPTASSGSRTLKVANLGKFEHHMVLYRVRQGVTFAVAIAALETGKQSAANPPVDYIGYAGVLSPGRVEWSLVTLTPGRYLVASFVTDVRTGKTDASEGMVAGFTVTLPRA